MTFGEKLKLARDHAGLKQEELGEMAGITRRSISAYENAGLVPRPKICRALAQALNVSVEYLKNEDIDDPNQGKQREAQMNAVRDQLGTRGAREAQKLLDQNAAFFAGGEMPLEDKDAFFEAVMSAYIACKETARARYGKARTVAR
jgi:transcriptional regulator with XRE-family HTH domain